MLLDTTLLGPRPNPNQNRLSCPRTSPLASDSVRGHSALHSYLTHIGFLHTVAIIEGSRCFFVSLATSLRSPRVASRARLESTRHPKA
jgi:hypothetical protein